MVISTTVLAKLPDPSPEAKEAADLAKAKTAWSDKVAAYKLCQAQNKVAKVYSVKAKVVDTPACADPGEFVAPTANAAPAAATTPAPVAAKPAETKPVEAPKK
jgi:hypothetical protein